MPAISRYFVKSGLVWFVLALAVALITELSLFDPVALRPLYWHMLMVGWITQIIMGVSVWMFPGRNRNEDIKENLPVWITLISLNTGLTLRVVSEPFVNSAKNDIWAVLLVASALLQWSSAVFYVAELWPRVMSKSQRLKKRKEI